MQSTLKSLLSKALETLSQQQNQEIPSAVAIHVERTKDPAHGDFATNLALLLAKPFGQPPRKIAEQLCALLPANESIEKVEIAGPGFINFYLAKEAATNVIKQILTEKEAFGRSEMGAGKTVLVEFVSANPTGPLHVGHGRGAAYGATVADVLAAVGYSVHREYYINDAGRQMDILATSIWLRYLQTIGEKFTFPSNGYRGDYLQPIVEKIQKQFGDQLRRSASEVFADVPPDEPQGGDKEAHIDALTVNAKNLLGNDFEKVFELGLSEILNDIREDLEEFGVNYQTWFSERQLVRDDAINQAFSKLQSAGHLYEKDGALWFRSTTFGDDKDRVVRRENGQTTYFAADIAYHFEKMQRGFSQLINILGSDHHGYVPRISAALQAFGFPADQFHALLVQFAILYRNGERVQMSTRSGSFITLRELRNEVGNDAARFFYVLRKSDQHLDFDLDLAKAQSQDNPLYYIQYANARVCSVFKQLENKNLSFSQEIGLQQVGLLTSAHEIKLLRRLPQYPEALQQAAIHYEPHRIAQYLRELATDLHSYYNAEMFIVDDENLRNARLSLVRATGQVITNGLHLLGVSAPETM